MQVMLTFGVLCQLALSVSETDWSYSANAPSYLPNADQSVLRNYLVPVLSTNSHKILVKKIRCLPYACTLSCSCS